MSSPYIRHAIQENRDEWLEHRMNFIGGSDAAAALGMSPWKSQFTLWCEKTRREVNDEDNESMRIGRDLEEYVADRFCEATGKKVRKSKYSYQSKEYPFMHANVDRLVIGEDAGLECKTTSALTRTKYDKGDIPIQYYLQCMHYMAVTGKKKWYIAVLVMGVGFYWFEVERNEEEIKILCEKEQEFWGYVLEDRNPPIDGSDSTTESLKHLYPQAQESFSCELFEVDNMIERYEEVKKLIKKLDKEKKEIENLLKKELGECSIGYTEKNKVQWKNSVTTRIDLDELKREYPDVYYDCLRESSSRRFSIRKVEEV